MSTNRNALPAWAVIALDLLLTAVLLGGWVLSRYADISGIRQQAAPPSAVSISDIVLPGEANAAAEAAPALSDSRSPLQIRFSEHFSDKTEVTENSYSSPNVSISISSNRLDTADGPVAYYLADVYLADPGLFQTWLSSESELGRHTAPFRDMMEESGALLAVNGDFAGFSYGGIILRNGTLYSSASNSMDICILYADGVMECVNSAAFDAEKAVARDAQQIWCFGPSRLDEHGAALTEYNANAPMVHVAGRNPRTAIGYMEPGHYCFLVADGRQPGYSVGIRLEEMGQIFSELGCQAAYNLDGGGSSMMGFQGDLVNQSFSGGRRRLPDILIIKDQPSRAYPVGKEMTP